ncbi:beta-glucosidase F-like protein [Emericellopsis cladophorae]|uniref:beta-glucosidase n=1 Tax=Emericellopsis cladophorae TaxID=2686198 RepID=A0A9P9Y7V0_9HYPO|nr:beta-glucosidase F-like protein [Emericellopsis cladophorae]KAI6784900.1 beta-glucosidase F-like protein [Emericellopsis cladophorae]
MVPSPVIATAYALISLLAGVSGSPLQQRSPDDVPDGYYVPMYYPAPFGGWVDSWAQSYEKARDLVNQMTLAEKTNITAGTGIFMGATFDKELMYQRGAAIGKEARGKGVHIWLGPSVGPLGRKPKGGRNWEGFGADPVLQGVGGRETIRGVQEQGVTATVKHLIGNEQEMYRMYNPFQYGYSANIDDRTLHELYLWPFAEAVRVGVGAVMTSYNAVNGSAGSQQPYLINGLLKDELGFQGLVMSDWISHMSGVDSALAGLDLDMPGDTQVPLFGSSFWMYEMTRAVLNGTVPMERLNDMATRVVATWYQMGQDSDDFPKTNFHTLSNDAVGDLYPAAWPASPKGVINEFVQVADDHHLVARQIAQEAITMLKNEDNLLPLPESRPLKVFGTAAQTNPDGPNACPDRNCNKGFLGQGWGSGTTDYMYIDDPLGALEDRAADVTFYNTDSFPEVDEPTKDDVAIVFITSDAGENSYTVEGNHGDRDASRLFAWHNGDKLVQDAAERYENVIVIAQTVGPLELEAWIDLPSVKSVLIQHMAGQEGGISLTNVLFGDASPCGHLPYSITYSEDDMPESVTKLIDSAFLNQPQDTYSEGLYIDYRWLNGQQIKPRYAFGHGLSYTSFSYGNATIEKVTQLETMPPSRPEKGPILEYAQSIPELSEAVAPAGFNKIPRYIYSWLTKTEAENASKDSENEYKHYPEEYTSTQKGEGPRAGGAQGGNPALFDTAYTVSVTVTNAGEEYAGKASVQLYLQYPEGIEYDTPPIQLRDFEKTGTLEVGESETVELTLTRKDVSVWDIEMQDWVVPEVDGAYKIWIGAASDDLGVVCRVDGLECENGVAGPVQ